MLFTRREIITAFAAAPAFLPLIGNHLIGNHLIGNQRSKKQLVQAATTMDANDFLKNSMNRYRSLKTLQAKVTWTSGYDEQEEAAAKSASPDNPQAAADATIRDFAYAAPNRFKVTATISGSGFVQTSVSDGTTLIEFSAATGAMRFDAPETIAAVRSMQMLHPMFCGSLLYHFFAGGDGISELVDGTKTSYPIRFGGEVTISGEPCRVVKFYATQQYGHVQVAISKTDNLVRQIRYDSEPTMKIAAASTPTMRGMKSVTIERYSDIKTNEDIAGTVFDTTAPKNTTMQDMRRSKAVEMTPPVPLGKPAPDLTVTPLNGGKPVTLSSLKGRVVLLDFWATWCPPCLRGLPGTLHLHKEFSEKGLSVLAITSEKAAVVGKFVSEKGFGSLPVFRDTNGAAGTAYKTEAIPTVAVIDRDGNLAAYFVGLQSPETLRDALKKAGLTGI